MTPTPIPAIPHNTVESLAELIAQQSTDRLLAIVMLLGLVFMIFALIVVWRAFPLVREGNRARFEMAKAYESNTEAMKSVKEELLGLRSFIESQTSKSLWHWVFGKGI